MPVRHKLQCWNVRFSLQAVEDITTAVLASHLSHNFLHCQAPATLHTAPGRYGCCPAKFASMTTLHYSHEFLIVVGQQTCWWVSFTRYVPTQRRARHLRLFHCYTTTLQKCTVKLLSLALTHVQVDDVCGVHIPSVLSKASCTRGPWRMSTGCALCIRDNFRRTARPWDVIHGRVVCFVSRDYISEIWCNQGSTKKIPFLRIRMVWVEYSISFGTHLLS